ncbi:chromatin-remodeling ATPase INO80-like [Humulus lupulus]|uniref:chromatin-remodeling ATPase INO80-like n=1 Tax=Humulus lupulus TaxID=3486 RepID=UPI002B415D21|nr:chromatin-remodeling ATPase INO80-like [Humulus lupulus]
MLRRVKTDVVSELTRKTKITVHCKLSSRQQAFYRAIKNKISLSELFDNNCGQLNEKKLLNLMNIVIQLRKVCNHLELFERSEGSTYLYFDEIPIALLPAPVGELEDVHYSGGRNPIIFKFYGATTFFIHRSDFSVSLIMLYMKISGQLKSLQIFASLTAERDGEIRKTALNTLTTGYKILGEDIWRYVGKLTDAQKSMLDDSLNGRFERWKNGRKGSLAKPELL